MIRSACTALPGAVGNTPLVRLQRMEPEHGGRLWAEPNPDGPGMRFSFSLPCHEPSA